MAAINRTGRLQWHLGMSVVVVGAIVDLWNVFTPNKVVGLVGFSALALGGILAATSRYRPRIPRSPKVK